MQRYWMVHCSGVFGGAPNVRHPSKAQARKEAKRLAEAHPGNAFTVLEAIDAYVKPTGGAVRVDISEPRHTQPGQPLEHEDDLPF